MAVGAGCNLALATDLRIASDAAKFGEVFSRIGLVPDGGGTYFLPRLVGTAKALELIMLGDIIEAEEAQRIGLLNRVVPADQLQAETQKLAERLGNGPTLAHGLAKTGVYQSMNMALEDVLNMEARNQAVAGRSEDRAEGATAFREKRPPRFIGRYLRFDCTYIKHSRWHREFTMADTYDLLLKGGEVIDPSQDLHRHCDVAFRDGRVAAIESDIEASTAEEVIDVSGYLVTPGLMDIHGHFFHRGWPGAVDPDTACLPSGVTTGVDAGSTGWAITRR